MDYDSPGFNPPNFGMPLAFSGGRVGPVPAGSSGETAGREAAEAADVLARPVISSPHASSQVEADMPTTPVPASQTQVPGQVPLREPFSGVDNTWRAAVLGDDPSTHVATPYHPNAIPVRAQ